MTQYNSVILQYLKLVYRKLVAVKNRFGVMGDLIVFVLVLWTVQNYVPFGEKIVTGITYLFAAMLVFSVSYILYLRIARG